MRVIFLGNRRIACEGLAYLLEKNADILAVVTAEPDDPVLGRAGLAQGLRVMSYKQLMASLDEAAPEDVLRTELSTVDVAVSFLFPKLIKEPLISLPRLGCLNFHPAPLPEYRGFAPFTFGIFERAKEWGVSAHYVDETFDTGDLIRVDRFPIDADRETARSLVALSYPRLLQQFCDVMDQLMAGQPLPRMAQPGGICRTKKDFEKLRQVSPGDSADVVERKSRAFFSPPHSGAYVTVGGVEFTVIGHSLLHEIGTLYR